MTTFDRAPGAQRNAVPSQHTRSQRGVEQPAPRIGRTTDAGDASLDPPERPRHSKSEQFADAAAKVFRDAFASQMDEFRRNRPEIQAAPPEARAMNVLVSVRNGAIGSVYTASGRIRMVHEDGPKSATFRPENVQRFNIDYQSALDDFFFKVEDNFTRADARVDPDLEGSERAAAFKNAYLTIHDLWMADMLCQGGQTPDWAQRVTGPEGLSHVDNLEPTAEKFLFEVYTFDDGSLNHSHISRGEAAYLPLDRETRTAIRDALSLTRGLVSPADKNQVFFDHLVAHAPDFAQRLAKP